MFQFPFTNIKVKVHKMFKILSILDNFKIQQLGDVLEWFFRGYLKVSRSRNENNIYDFSQEEWGMTSVDFRNGDWGKLRGQETTKLDREILADIAGHQNDLGLRWFLMHPVHV